MAIAGFRGEAIGVWIAALLTLMIFSFLYKDNPLYRFAEHLFAGVSIGYLVGLSYQPIVCPNVVRPLTSFALAASPMEPRARFLDYWVTSGHHRFLGCGLAGLHVAPQGALPWSNLTVLLPLAIGLCTLIPFLFPKHAWLTSLPFALVIGYGTGMTIPATIQTSLLAQMEGTVYPFYAFRHGDATWAVLLSSVLVLVGLLATLSYFYFSAEHKGWLKTSSRLGIGFVMIGFGAAFGLTVMARISLLVARLDFLLYRWLGLH